MLNAWMKGCDSFLGIQDTLKALADPIRREILNLLKTVDCRQERSANISGDGGFHIEAFVGTKGGRSDQGQAGRKVYLL